MKTTLKRTLVIALAIVTVLGLFAGCSSSGKSLEKKIVGSWTGEIDGEEITYTFEKLQETTDDEITKAGYLTIGEGSSGMSLSQTYWSLDGKDILIIRRSYSLGGGVSTNIIDTMTLEKENGKTVLVNEDGDMLYKDK